MQAIPPGKTAPLKQVRRRSGKPTGPFGQSIGNNVTQSYGTKVFSCVWMLSPPGRTANHWKRWDAKLRGLNRRSPRMRRGLHSGNRTATGQPGYRITLHPSILQRKEELL